MKNRLKLATIALILMACCFLSGNTVPQAKAGVGDPKCVLPEQLWCIGGTDGNPMWCYCSVKP